MEAVAAQPVSARQQWAEVLAAAQGETTTTTRVTLLGEVCSTDNILTIPALFKAPSCDKQACAWSRAASP